MRHRQPIAPQQTDFYQRGSKAELKSEVLQVDSTSQGSMSTDVPVHLSHTASPSVRQSARLRRVRAQVLTVFLLALIFVPDYMVPANVVLSFFYAFALFPAVLIRSRRWLWGVVVISTILTIVATVFGSPVDPGSSIAAMWANRIVVLASIWGLCLVLDRYLVNITLREQASLRWISALSAETTGRCAGCMALAGFSMKTASR